jgi:hypothetical protein
METDQNEQLKNLVHKKLCEIVEAGSSAAMTWPQFEDYVRVGNLGIDSKFAYFSVPLFRSGFVQKSQRRIVHRWSMWLRAVRTTS